MATKYVRKTGNDDTGDGSVGAPFLTIKAALAAITEDDTVNVGAGTFTEAYDANFGVWMDKTATIQGAGAASTIIIGTATASGEPFAFRDTSGTGTHAIKDCTLKINTGGGGRAFFNVANAGRPVLIEDCTIDNSDGTNTIGWTLNATGEGFTCTRCAFIMTTSNTWYGASGKACALTLNNCTGTITAPVGFTLVAAAVTVSGGTLAFNTTGATFKDVANALDIQDASFTLGSTHDQFILAAAGTGAVTVKNNTIATAVNPGQAFIQVDTAAHAVNITGNRITLTSSAFADNVIEITDQASPVVANNVIDTLAAAGCTAHIAVGSTGTASGTALISGNVCKSISGNATYVIRVGTEDEGTGDNDLDGAIVENNCILAAGYWGVAPGSCHAVMVGFNAKAEIRNNLIYGAGYGVVIKGTEAVAAYAGVGGVIGNTFVNNTIDDVHLKGCDSVRVEGNTCYVAPSIAGVYGRIRLVNNNTEAYYTADPSVGYSTNAIIRRNIVCSFANTVFLLVDSRSYTNADAETTDANSILSINDNVYWHDSADAAEDVFKLAQTGYTFAEWQAAGKDSRSVFADPQFIAPTAGDFRVKDTSAAINWLDGGVMDQTNPHKHALQPVAGAREVAYDRYFAGRGNRIA